jgi:hypothetical protein
LYAVEMRVTAENWSDAKDEKEEKRSAGETGREEETE